MQAADLSADPDAVVRRGQHQSPAGQEGRSGEQAALLLGRRQWETVGAGSLPTHSGCFWLLRLPRRGCLVHNGEPNMGFGKGAMWANSTPVAICSRNDQVTSSQTWEQGAHFKLQACACFPDCCIKPGFEAALEHVPRGLPGAEKQGRVAVPEVGHRQPQERGGIRKLGEPGTRTFQSPFAFTSSFCGPRPQERVCPSPR